MVVGEFYGKFAQFADSTGVSPPFILTDDVQRAFDADASLLVATRDRRDRCARLPDIQFRAGISDQRHPTPGTYYHHPFHVNSATSITTHRPMTNQCRLATTGLILARRIATSILKNPEFNVTQLIQPPPHAYVSNR